MIIFAIDFDHTVPNGHINNIIFSAIKKDPALENDHERQWSLARQVRPTGGAAAWRNIFNQIAKLEDCMVSIVTFNIFTKIIERYLKEVIGLDAATFKKITILSKEPYIDCNKNEHINELVEIAKKSNPDEKITVLLIDDSLPHLIAAEKIGCETIYADANGDFLNEIQKKISSIIQNKAAAEELSDENETDYETSLGGSESDKNESDENEIEGVSTQNEIEQTQVQTSETKQVESQAKLLQVHGLYGLENNPSNATVISQNKIENPKPN